jgi:ParB family chromosome partitioning protein
MSSHRGSAAWPLGSGAGRGGRPRGMGRGLAAIMAVSTDQESGVEEFRQIAIELIHPNPRQPRRRFDEDALSALASSMQARGLLQPVLVRPGEEGRFELIAGERRWRAAGIAGLETIPALVRVRDDSESLELALIENMAREDLNPVEEARACAALVEELGLSREEVGVRIGRSRVAVSNLVRLLDLPDEALELLETGTLSEGHGRALLIASDHGARRRLARSAADEGWSVRELEARARDANRADAEERGPGPTAREPHPDQLDACATIGEALSGALGAEVRVMVARGGAYRVEMLFETPAEALELAERLQQRTGHDGGD